MGPEVVYDDDSGQIAIISGKHLFTVKIWDDNQPPVAVHDAFSASENEPLEVSAPGVLANDTDDGSGALAAVLVSGPRHGLLDLRPDGSFTYVPNLDFNREDSFTYRATDGSYESNVAMVSITVETLYPWHNGLKPRDVSDDGLITSLDALRVINELNRGNGGPLSAERTRPLTQPFYDTTRNNHLEPRDALLVINYLNANGPDIPGGEGEQAVDASNGSVLETAAPTGLLIGEPTAIASDGAIASVDAAWAGDVGVAEVNALEIGWATTVSPSARDRSNDVDDVWAVGELEALLGELWGEVADD